MHNIIINSVNIFIFLFHCVIALNVFFLFFNSSILVHLCYEITTQRRFVYFVIKKIKIKSFMCVQLKFFVR